MGDASVRLLCVEMSESGVTVTEGEGGGSNTIRDARRFVPRASRRFSQFRLQKTYSPRNKTSHLSTPTQTPAKPSQEPQERVSPQPRALLPRTSLGRASTSSGRWLRPCRIDRLDRPPRRLEKRRDALVESAERTLRTTEQRTQSTTAQDLQSHIVVSHISFRKGLKSHLPRGRCCWKSSLTSVEKCSDPRVP